jgi:hypothetical protein
MNWSKSFRRYTIRPPRRTNGIRYSDRIRSIEVVDTPRYSAACFVLKTGRVAPLFSKARAIRSNRWVVVITFSLAQEGPIAFQETPSFEPRNGLPLADISTGHLSRAVES